MDPDLQIRGGGGGGGGGGGEGGRPEPEIRGGGRPPKNLFRSFRPHFGLKKMPGNPGSPDLSPGSATATNYQIVLTIQTQLSYVSCIRKVHHDS